MRPTSLWWAWRALSREPPRNARQMTEELTFEPAQIGVRRDGHLLRAQRLRRGPARVTFDDADASEFVIGCHYPGHYDAGMRAIITVSGG